ncbi:hypothetical protein AB0A76_12720 [Streptomyces exfoliatus]|uniref:Uncharacterized protein n=1 Tax=Streptomyces exfoliatus TaxID=1905 RepID=A0ABV3CWP9_STREX
MRPVRRAPRIRGEPGVRGGGARHVGGHHGAAAPGRHHPDGVLLAASLVSLVSHASLASLIALVALGVPLLRYAVRDLHPLRDALRHPPRHALGLRLSRADRGRRYAPAPGARADRHRGTRPLRVERRAQRRPRPQRLRLPGRPARR